ncbi:TPA: restriction endonuclease subunit S [Klebsiella quasipneumoniae subsp. quasipneumoniae]|nr:restriction endonuclease subunit S [Klebsiella quasipneumoniae]HBR1509828.1 restriction endonuclease subunit S [Klebsiella quasipneumoniae subsp. quasipneumoniae]HCI6696466.1 restriction endonuclease subunit S [Klebsiella quasipneumoniae subsp. quasipneumoniae]
MSMTAVPVGYKQTEVGIIPKDWIVVPFFDVVSIASGQVSPLCEPYCSMVLVAPDHIEAGTGLLINKQTAKEQNSISGKYVFHPGDTLYSKIRPYLKKAIYANFNGLCSADMYPLRPKEGIEPKFILPLILGERFSKYAESVSARSGMPKINRAEIADFLFVMPSQRKEQTAISNVLFDTDKLIIALEKIIAKKLAIKIATMQQLLTGRTRLTQFAQYPNGTIKNYKSSELGLIPEDWEVARLAQVAKVIDPHPSHRAPPEESYGVPFVGIGDLNESGEIVNSDVRRVNQSILQEHSERYSLNNQPIGLGRVASIGKVIRLRVGKEPYAISPTLGVIDGFACRNDFLFYYLKSESVTEQFSRVMSGSTRSSVGMNVLKEILVVKMSSDEQISIATVLSDMDAELTALEQKLAKFRDIKQGMMQQLLTGRIRLPLDRQP